MRRPNLDQYDSSAAYYPDGSPKELDFSSPAYLSHDLVFGDFGDDIDYYAEPDDWSNVSLLQFFSADRSHDGDTVMLKAFGVDGSVPLDEAKKQIGVKRAPPDWKRV